MARHLVNNDVLMQFQLSQIKVDLLEMGQLFDDRFIMKISGESIKINLRVSQDLKREGLIVSERMMKI